MPLLMLLFDDCRNTPKKNGAHDERMLLFQALSPHARDHYRTYRPSRPVVGAATDLRHSCHRCGKHFSRDDTLRVHVAMHDGKSPYPVSTAVEGSQQPTT